MMGAARVNRLHYNKKRTPTTKKATSITKRASSSSGITVSVTPASNNNGDKDSGGGGDSAATSKAAATSKTNGNTAAAATGSPSSSASPSASNALAIPELPHQLRKRSGSVPALKVITLALSWNMKPSHIRALKATWSRLCEPPRSNCKGIVALVERVWEKLDSKDRNIREIFYRAAFVDSMNERCERRRSNNSIATLRDHTHFFVSLVSQTVQHLDDEPSEMFAHIDKIGRNHAYLKQYGFKSSHWEKVGEYFVDTVVVQDCVRVFPEACRAWTLLVAALVDRLRAAPRRGSVGGAAVGLGTQDDSSLSIRSAVRIFGSGNVLCSPTPSSTPRASIDYSAIMAAAAASPSGCPAASPSAGLLPPAIPQPAHAPAAAATTSLSPLATMRALADKLPALFAR